MTKKLILLFILMFSFRLNAEMTDVGPYLVNIKNKTDQSTAHISDTVRHVLQSDKDLVYASALTNRSNVFTAPNSFTTNVTINVQGGNALTLQKAGVTKAYFDDVGSLYVGDFQRTDSSWAMSQTTLRTRSNWLLGWSAGTTYVPVDTTLSRQSAGVLRIGTGSTGNSLGSLSVSNVYSHDVYVDDIPASWSTSPIIPSLYKNITDLGAPASPVVVNLTPAQTIYKVEVSAVNTLSNNFSGISFSTARNVEWETWINYTTTNSLSTTWPANIEWLSGVPELTVTGQYKFAFSTIDGVNVQAKQIYPTSYSYSQLLTAGPSGSPTSTRHVQSTVPTSATGSTNLLALGCAPDRPMIYKIAIYAGQVDNRTYIGVGRGLWYTATIPTLTSILFPMTMVGYSIGTDSLLTVYVPARTGYSGFDYLLSTQDSVSTFMQLHYAGWKFANELEVKAYNAGWRP